MEKFFYRLLVVFMLAITLHQPLLGQSRQYISSGYDRNALTILLLQTEDTYNAQLLSLADSLKVPEKFFDNSLTSSLLPFKKKREEITIQDNYAKTFAESLMTEVLQESKIPNQILAKWFDRKKDGSFGVSTLSERGVYNATDNAVLVANASKRGTAGLKDMGMGLIDNSYIMVLDVAQLMSMSEMYELDSVPADQRTMNGFRAKINTYVYKLDFSEAVASNFFENLWISSDSDNKNTKAQLFDNTQFPIKPIEVFSSELAATQLNPGQKYAPKEQRSPKQLLLSLLETSLSQSILKLEQKEDAFRVKAMIFDVKPIAVKIGRKEGLKFDQRYFVYENRQDRRGNVYSKRRGVIRSMSVADNRKLADGSTETSYFYQVAGRKIDNMGMFIEQKNASNINLYFGYTEGSIGGGVLRFELMFSPILYQAFGGSSIKKGMTAWKLHLEGGYWFDTYSFEDFNFFHGSFGLSKEFRLTRNIFIDPYLGYGFETASPTNNSAASFDSQFLSMGARLGLNIKHNIQLVPSLNYAAIILSEYSKDKESDPVEFDYHTKFEGRAGIGIGLGLRLMF